MLSSVPTGSAPKRGIIPSPGKMDYRSLKKQMREASAAPMTKKEARVEKALSRASERDVNAAKSSAHEGVSENPMKQLERKEHLRKSQMKTERGTSAARIKQYGNEEEDDLELEEDRELKRRAAEARLGIASPLPRSVLRPTNGIVKKR